MKKERSYKPLTVYIFFNIEGKPMFKLEMSPFEKPRKSLYETAMDIVNTSGGQLYFRELKDKKLIITVGLKKGEEGPEKLSAADIKQLQIEGEMKAEKYYLEVEPQHYLKADPQPRYLVINLLGGSIKIPHNLGREIGTIKDMFDELLKIDGVKGIMEKYGVTFHKS